MITRTLLARICDSSQLADAQKTIASLLEGLIVETKIQWAFANRWVQISFSGEDEGIASNYVAKEVGFSPTCFEDVKRFTTLKGYVVNLEKNKEELQVDLGVFQPKIVYATVPLRHLQAQLVDGRKIALKKIVELYGFCEDLPLEIKVVRVDEEAKSMEAELSVEQVGKYVFWQESLLDRLIVIGSSLYDVKRILNRDGLTRDVINIETLGMFEHVLTCKLGTDAAGLIPRIGRRLKTARFAVFNPKRLKEFLEV
jgi:hypothetical protein